MTRFDFRKVFYPLLLLFKFMVSLIALLPFISPPADPPPPQPESNPALDAYLEELHQAKLNEVPPPPAPTSYGGSVDQWTVTVRKYFNEADVGWAMRVIACESGGNPDSVNGSSGATGLFQHLPQYWGERAAGAGFAGYPANNPEANIAASAYLFYRRPDGGPGHWVCK